MSIHPASENFYGERSHGFSGQPSLVLHYLPSGVIFHYVHCKPLRLKTGLWSYYIICHYQDKLCSIIFVTALRTVADCY